jgi:hypothetical protein
MRVFDGTLICCCFQRSGHRVILRVDSVVDSRVEVIVLAKGGASWHFRVPVGGALTTVAAFRPAVDADKVYLTIGSAISREVPGSMYSRGTLLPRATH